MLQNTSGRSIVQQSGFARKFFGAAVSLLFSLLLVQPVAAQEVLFLIRHAERDWSSDDAGLVDAGRARAVAWADVLADAGIDLIITSEMTRTRETGQLISDQLEVPTLIVPRDAPKGLIELLQTEYSDDRVLVVGHSGTIPDILWRLGYKKLVVLLKSDYNDLFVVRSNEGGEVDVVRLNID